MKEKRAYVTFESVKPLGYKPKFFTSGGYRVLTPFGEVLFDWLDAYTIFTTLPDGRVRVEIERRNFDLELYLSSNEVVITDIESLTRYPLAEIAYDIEGVVLFYLVEFKIGDSAFSIPDEINLSDVLFVKGED